MVSRRRHNVAFYDNVSPAKFESDAVTSSFVYTESGIRIII